MKTKHIIITIIGVFWLALQCTQAQTEYTAYQFENRANGQFLSLADDESGITLTEKTNSNRLNQYFILKRLGDGKVLIASAQNFDIFLKNDGTFSEISGATDDYEWEINFSGNSGSPYCILVAVNKASDPVLGTASSGETVQFYAQPTDVYNDSSERVCFNITSRTKIF